MASFKHGRAISARTWISRCAVFFCPRAGRSFSPRQIPHNPPPISAPSPRNQRFLGLLAFGNKFLWPVSPPPPGHAKRYPCPIRVHRANRQPPLALPGHVMYDCMTGKCPSSSCALKLSSCAGRLSLWAFWNDIRNRGTTA